MQQQLSRGPALSDMQHMTTAVEGAAAPAAKGCSEVSQRTGAHFSSLSEIWKRSSHFGEEAP